MYLLGVGGGYIQYRERGMGGLGLSVVVGRLIDTIRYGMVWLTPNAHYWGYRYVDMIGSGVGGNLILLVRISR